MEMEEHGRTVIHLCPPLMSPIQSTLLSDSDVNCLQYLASMFRNIMYFVPYKIENVCLMLLYDCHAFHQETIPWMDTSCKAPPFE